MELKHYPWVGLVQDTEALCPFVQMHLERDITTVVGANEAGKSQLITVIQCLFRGQPSASGTPVATRPSSASGGTATPGVWPPVLLPDGRRTAVRHLLSPRQRREAFRGFGYSRFSGARCSYYRKEVAFAEPALDDQQLQALQLPRANRVDADVALPASVSPYDLLSGATALHVRDRVSWHSIHNDPKEKRRSVRHPWHPSDSPMPPFGTQTPRKPNRRPNRWPW